MARVTITEWLHQQLKYDVENAELCIDATAGKGNDTLFFCENMKETGQVVAFDIQEKALELTEELLEKKGYYNERVSLYLDGHENMDRYIKDETADVIMFNLGYLPGGDHNLATKPEHTILAIEKGLSCLKPNGVMSVCIYSGGDSGFEERDRVLEFLQQLDPRRYTVIVSSFYNKPNQPPIPVLIRKEN